MHLLLIYGTAVPAWLFSPLRSFPKNLGLGLPPTAFQGYFGATLNFVELGYVVPRFCHASTPSYALPNAIF